MGQMAIDITASTVIEAPRETVAGFVIDHRNDTAWIGGISESVLEGEEPLGVGSRVRRVASFLGRKIEYVNEIERLEPGTLLQMRSVEGPIPMVITCGFEHDLTGRTKASVRVRGEPGTLYRIAGPLLAKQVKRSVSKDLRTLKRILENKAL